MISTTREEREWFLRNLAQGLTEYSGAVEPPVQVEEMLKHPPDVFSFDFGVVDMYSNIWDATFARPPSRRGSIFVRVNLTRQERRYALARETLSALITSKHGRSLGLPEMLMDVLQESAEYFAGHLLAPEALVSAYIESGGTEDDFAETFVMPEQIARGRFEEATAAIH